MGEHGSWIGSFATGLVETFKPSLIKIFLALVRVLAAEGRINVSDSEVPLTFLNSEYLMWVYTDNTRC